MRGDRVSHADPWEETSRLEKQVEAELLPKLQRPFLDSAKLAGMVICDRRTSENRRPRSLNELEVENARLRRAVVTLTLDKLMLADAAHGTSKHPE
jgi:hypothetical protein